MKGLLFAFTLPSLVLGLLVLGVVELVANRARRRRGGQATPGGFTGAGLDVLQAALFPERRHELEEKASQRQRRDDEDDGAPPHSTVDLASGVARLRLPSTLHSHGDKVGDREVR